MNARLLLNVQIGASTKGMMIMLKFKIGENMSIIGTFTCPKCSAVSEHNLSEKRAGDSIACRCGARVQLTDDGFAEARREFLDFKKFMEGLSK